MMNLGYAGVQMAWGLQMANASSIFESLGAAAQQIPVLWLAAPMSGFIIQPLVGYWSDRTQSPLGKRKPYFLVGGIIGSLALIALPFASSLAIAVSLIWIMDIFVNMAMTPFRSFVTDVVPEQERTKAFTTQSLSHGIGAFLASVLPWCLLKLFHHPQLSPIDNSVRLSLWIGAGILCLSLLGTIFFSPPDLEQPANRTATPQISAWTALITMPGLMRQLAGIQCFSWMAIFCIFLYLPPAIAHNIYGAASEHSPQFASGIAWGGICLACLNLFCAIFALSLSQLSQSIPRATVHGYSLLLGSLCLFSLPWISSASLLLIPMVGIGLAWASMLSLPYALLSEVIPEELNGFYMGIFNCFITLPQIFISFTLGGFMVAFLNGDRMAAVALGGVFMLIAAVLSFRITPDIPEH